jgi:glycosyltransferase involved in cell wall biosynthesis
MWGVQERRPCVSVGLPVYNGERYLSAALDSILAQTFEDFELVVSDNGSTDGTQEIVRDFLGRDDRVRYVRVEDNRGAMWNFNEVFQQSRGEFFKPACHDDLHEPEFLERCLDAYREAPASVVLVYPRTRLIDEDGVELGSYDDRLDLRGTDPAERLRAYLANVRMVNPLFGVHRTRTFASTRRFQSFVSADVVLLAELAMRGEFWELPDALFLRRDHAGRSERAHATKADLARFYDPRRRHRTDGKRLAQTGGLFRAAWEAPLPLRQRLRCGAVVGTGFAYRYKGALRRETVAAVRSFAPTRTERR